MNVTWMNSTAKIAETIQTLPETVHQHGRHGRSLRLGNTSRRDNFLHGISHSKHILKHLSQGDVKDKHWDNYGLHQSPGTVIRVLL